MATISKPEFNWDGPCMEQELIRWDSVALENLKINNTGRS